MSFSSFLNSSDYDTKEDIVGLAVYFLDQVEGRDDVRKKEIKKLILDSRANVQGNYIHTCFNRLSEKGYLSSSHTGYILSFDGIDYYRDKISEDYSKSKSKDLDFLRLETGNRFYDDLIDDINKSYRHSINDGTMILTRKLLENILVDTFREFYGMEKQEIFFDKSKGQFKNFSKLIDEFDNRKEELEPLSDGGIRQSITDELHEFRWSGNAGGHTVKTTYKEDEMRKKSEKLEELLAVLLSLRDKAKRLA